jgi:hypothetical protein
MSESGAFAEDSDDIFLTIPKRGELHSPFTIPCPVLNTEDSKGIGLFSGFASSKAVKGGLPFQVASPFEIQDEYSLQISLLSQGSFSDLTTSSSSTSLEHTSASGTLGIGCDFLGASVSVSYDKTVQDDKKVRSGLFPELLMELIPGSNSNIANISSTETQACDMRKLLPSFQAPEKS